MLRKIRDDVIEACSSVLFKMTKSAKESFLNWRAFFEKKSLIGNKISLEICSVSKESQIERSVFLAYFDRQMSGDRSDYYSFPKQRVKYGPKQTDDLAIYLLFWPAYAPKRKSLWLNIYENTGLLPIPSLVISCIFTWLEETIFIRIWSRIHQLMQCRKHFYATPD